MTLPSQFWSDFWPTLASTFAGVVVGVPLGLWLNREAVKHSETSRRASERLAVVHTLEMLGDAIQDNLSRLDRLGTIVAAQQALFDPGLDTTSWPALQPGLTAELKNPELRRGIARFFSRVRGIDELNRRYLDLNFSVDAAMQQSQAARASLSTAIPAAVNEVTAEGRTLIAEIARIGKLLAA